MRRHNKTICTGACNKGSNDEGRGWEKMHKREMHVTSIFYFLQNVFKKPPSLEPFKRRYCLEKAKEFINRIKLFLHLSVMT